MEPALSLGISFLFVGFFLLTAIVLWHQTRRFIEQSYVTSGVVIDLKLRAARRGQRLYAPVVRFTAHDGQIVVFTDDQSKGGPHKYRVEAQVRVRYHRQDFRQARIASSDGELYWGAKLIGGLGLLFFVITILMGMLAYALAQIPMAS